MAVMVEAIRTFTLARERAGDTRGPWGWWADSRFTALVRALERTGAPLELARFCASCILVLATKETGWPVREWNFNPWNLRGQFGGYSAVRPDAGVDHPFRAYPDIDASAGDVIRVLSAGARYRHAWSDLVRGRSTMVEWYAAILEAGYGPPTQANIDEYSDLVGLVRQRYDAYLRGTIDVPGTHLEG